MAFASRGLSAEIRSSNAYCGSRPMRMPLPAGRPCRSSQTAIKPVLPFQKLSIAFTALSNPASLSNRTANATPHRFGRLRFSAAGCRGFVHGEFFYQLRKFGRLRPDPTLLSGLRRAFPNVHKAPFWIGETVLPRSFFILSFERR